MSRGRARAKFSADFTLRISIVLLPLCTAFPTRCVSESSELNLDQGPVGSVPAACCDVTTLGRFRRHGPTTAWQQSVRIL